jgi:hypothetical protein
MKDHIYFQFTLKIQTYDNVSEWNEIYKWAASRQNQHSVFGTSMDPDQPAHPLPTLLQVEKLIANSIDPDQTAQMRRLVLIHAGRKPIMLVLSWRGSNNLTIFIKLINFVSLWICHWNAYFTFFLVSDVAIFCQINYEWYLKWHC